MKNYVLVLVLFILIVGVISVIAYLGFAQESIGVYADKDSCLSALKDDWCRAGYKCTDCNREVLPFSVIINGRSTNIVYSSDCTLNPQNAPVPDQCQGSLLVSSHATYRCYQDDVYWYDSAGKREDLKESCSNGCVQSTPMYASCQKTVNTPSGQSICFPDGIRLCKNGILQGTNILCDVSDVVSCEFGCGDGKCIQPKCVNECDKVLYMECSNDLVSRRCEPDRDGCLVWKDYPCPVDTYCVMGECTAEVVDNLVVAGDSCINVGEVFCVSDYSYRSCDGVLSEIRSCPDGSACNGGVCVPINTTPFVIEDGGVCDSVCDDFNYLMNGKLKDGVCVYDDVEVNSPKCIQANAMGLDIPKGFYIFMILVFMGVGVLLISSMGKN